MKNLTLTLILILSSFSAFCQQKNAISIEDQYFNNYFMDKTNIPVVKGRVLNVPPKDINKASINYTLVTPFEKTQVKKSCKLNPDGTFELELDNAFPYQQIWISAGRLFYAGIYANKDLFIELDAQTLIKEKGVKFNGPGIKYMGTDGALNTYMNNHILFKRNEQLELNKALSIIKRDNKLDDNAFIAKYDSIYSIINNIDKDFMKQNPSDFSWIISNERQSDYYADLCVKYWGKVMNPELFEKVKKHKSYLNSNNGAGFYNYLYTYLSINAGKRQKKGITSYKAYSKLKSNDVSILDSIIQMEKNISQSMPFDTIKLKSLIKQANLMLHDTLIVEKTLHTITFLDSIFEKPKADFLKIRITSKDPNEQTLITETVLDNIDTEWCKIVIQKQYDENLEKLATINKVLQNSKTLTTQNELGEPIAELPSGAKLYKVANMKPEALLSNLKKSFENKALILDFWATWCAPCIQEMPYSKKLHNDTKDLPVEFVYLCTSSNSSIEKWKAKIAELGIGGTHIFVEQNIENELMNLFSVSGFPSYVFINNKGEYKPGVISRMSYLDKNKLAELIK